MSQFECELDVCRTIFQVSIDEAAFSFLPHHYILTAAPSLLVFLLSLSRAYGHECNVESVPDHNLMHVVNGVLTFLMLEQRLKSLIIT